MGDRGPLAVHDYDEVAFVCRVAHARGESMTFAVERELGVGNTVARSLITRARGAGYGIPHVRADLATEEVDGEYLPVGVYEELFTPEPWTERAACRMLPPDMFFPRRGHETATAKAVCATCPVCAECLDAALRRGEKFGIWGGTSERERRAMRRQIRVQAHTGTVA